MAADRRAAVRTAVDAARPATASSYQTILQTISA
jgi:hypothetical protein